MPTARGFRRWYAGCRIDYSCWFVEASDLYDFIRSSLSMPLLDVVKTRLQAERRAGQTHYKGLFHALVTIPREEGMKALFKGWSARVVVSGKDKGSTN